MRPAIGDRVHVTPATGLKVQRGENLFGQFLPPEGMDVVWSEFHHRRMDAGELFPSEMLRREATPAPPDPEATALPQPSPPPPPPPSSEQPVAAAAPAASEPKAVA